MNSDSEMPSLPEQGVNLSKAIFDIFQETLKGNDILVDKFESKRRYDICQVCEHFHNMQKRCKKCGCYMEKKVEFTASKCPIDKW